MNLKKHPFDSIEAGSKVYELRLYDEKRRAVSAGDFIEFTCEDGRKQLVRVTEIRVFPDFAALYAAIDPAEMGYTDEPVSPHDMDIYYPPEKQRQFGAVAFKIEVV